MENNNLSKNNTTQPNTSYIKGVYQRQIHPVKNPTRAKGELKSLR